MEYIRRYGHILASAAGLAAIGYACFLKYKVKACQINHSVNKSDPKVVHEFDAEDLDTKNVYCRCWRSRKFPYCDGSHKAHNESTGDNVGPLIIKKKEKSEP